MSEKTTAVWTEGVCGDGAAILRDGIPVSISDLLTRLNEVERHDTPAWRANERLNERVEICYKALERIIAETPPPQYERIARRALEAAARVA